MDQHSDIRLQKIVIGLSTNILWTIRISLLKKLALSGIFSVTIFVIAVSIVRVVVSTRGNAIDMSLVTLWGAIELSVGMY
jgi:hypothetical protein